MSEVEFKSSSVSDTDRLLIMVFIAVLFHVLLILGVNFDLPQPEKIARSLQIALVNAPTRSAPKEADYLAAENQVGSGDQAEQSEPRPQQRVAAGGAPPAEPAPVIEKPRSRPKQPAVERVVTKSRSETRVSNTPEQEKQAPVVTRMPELNDAFLSRQISMVGAEIAQVEESRTKRPRMMFINSVNAHRYKAAEYERAWKRKIERVGNLNYPDEARRKKLSGSLILAVGVKPDGRIYSINIRRSSGHKALDDGAIRIVRLAAPFAPFPSGLSDDADVLIITRTWKFTDDSMLSTSR